jgi:quercetin dioxygenase-like cupin family protein
VRDRLPTPEYIGTNIGPGCGNFLNPLNPNRKPARNGDTVPIAPPIVKTSTRPATPARRGPAEMPFAGAEAAVLDGLLLTAMPVKLAAGRKAALKNRILAGAAPKAAARPRARNPAIITVPASDQGWVEAMPKIHIKQVYTDGIAESYLVRLDPGARAPAHGHPGDEECVVLEGSIRYIGGSTLNAGDYEAVLAGGRHAELVSDSGALVYLRYSQPLAGYLQL